MVWWVVRISSHNTVCLIGSPLEKGCSLIFWIGNKNTWEKEKQSKTLNRFSKLCLLWIKKARVKDKVEDKTYIWVLVWWKTKNEIWEIYTSRIQWVVRGTGTPKDRDEVNRRDVYECDGWVCVLEVIDTPSILSVIRKSTALTRVLSTFVFRVVKNPEWWRWNSPLVDCASWTPEVEKKTVSFPMSL